MRSFISKKLCWFMSIILLYTWSVPSHIAFGQAERQLAAADPSKLAVRLERMFKALEAAEREIPRDTFDASAIVDKVGKDPVKLFEWVRDNTYLVPYRGALRGWQGVLMDRLGNSLDRALLLGELLHQAGHRGMRFAYAPLTREKTLELLKKTIPIPKGGAVVTPRISTKQTDEQIQKVAQRYQLDGAELRKQIEEITRKSDRLAKEAVQRTVEQAKIIAAEVKKYRVKEDPKARIAKMAAALQDHWWIQLRNGSQWKDLDPSLPSGRPVAQAQETFQGNKLQNRLFDEVHTLQIRVIIERWVKGRLEEVPVFTQQLWPLNLIGERIAIHHAPMNWPEDLNLFQEEDPIQALKTTVLDQHEWVPVLSVGSARISKLSFTDTGQVKDPTLPGFVQNVLAGRELVRGFESGAEKVGQDIKDILTGGGFGGRGIQIESAEEPQRSARETNEGLKVNKPSGRSQLTAEWIEYEIRVPGEKRRKIRRQIFDLVGPAARAEWKGQDNIPEPEIKETDRLERGFALLGQTEILPLVSQLSPRFIEHLITKNMLANQKVLLRLLRTAGSAAPATFTDQLSKLTLLPGQLYSLALARQEWSRFREDVYLDSLNILSNHKHFKHNPKGEMVFFQSFDIVANEVAAQSGTDGDPFLIRLESGVLDTNAEALLAMASCRSMENIAGCGELENTAELFNASRKRGIEWLAIESQTIREAVWEKVKLPENIRARIEQEFEAGYMVLAPKQEVSLQGYTSSGWWRVDLRTGQTLGFGKNGWGDSAVEYYATTFGLALVTFFPVLMAACLFLGFEFNACLWAWICTLFGAGAMTVPPTVAFVIGGICNIAAVVGSSRE